VKAQQRDADNHGYDHHPAVQIGELQWRRRMRAIGTGVATSWLPIASAIGPSPIGFMLGADGVASIFLMFAGVALVGLIIATQMIETRNLRLEDIAR